MVPTSDLKEIIHRLNYLRGLFAILIVMGHCSMAFEKELLPFFIIHKFNMVGVCFFFYISALSITYNFYNKQGYLKHFVRNKIVFFIVIACVSLLVGNLLKTIFLQVPLYFNLTLLTTLNWYVYEMLVFYFLFFLLYSLIDTSVHREILMTVITLCICLITIYFDRYGSWTGWTKSYYLSCFSFPFGIVMGEHYDRIKRKFCKHGLIYSSALFLVSLGCCISLILPDSNLGGVLLKNFMGICVMALVTVFVSFINVQSIPIVGSIISFLTKQSAEIYLYQFSVLDIVQKLYERNNMAIDISYILFSVAGVCVIAYMMRYIDVWIAGKIKV